MRAVSYTHLDVYKRQSTGWADGPTKTTRYFEQSDSITIVAPVFERSITSSDSDPFSDPFRSGTPPSSSRPILQATPAPSIIGFVSLTLSKTKLQNDIRNIKKHIVTVMWIGIAMFTIAMLLLLRRITDPITVSYTHLDVYKRQILFPTNVAQQVGRGVELEARWDIDNRTQLYGAYSYQKNEDHTTNTDIGYGPHHLLLARLQRQQKPWNVSCLLYTSRCV